MYFWRWHFSWCWFNTLLILTSPALAGSLSCRRNKLSAQSTFSLCKEYISKPETIIRKDQPPTWRGQWWCRWWLRRWRGWWPPPPGSCGPCCPLVLTPGKCFLRTKNWTVNFIQTECEECKIQEGDLYKDCERLPQHLPHWFCRECSATHTWYGWCINKELSHFIWLIWTKEEFLQYQTRTKGYKKTWTSWDVGTLLRARN